MKTTVIIPFYNEESTISQTLNSLREQSRPADVVFMIDSGSNDKTAEIIKEFQKNNPALHLQLFQPMLGNPSSSINYGIEKSKTELIAYIDCGLNIPVDWLEKHYEQITSNDADLISCQIYTTGINSVDKSLIAQTYGYNNSTPCLPGSMIKRDLFEKIGLFKYDMRAGYDIDFIKRVSEYGVKRIINKDLRLTYYGINYAKNYLSAVKKIFSYSKTGWRTKGDQKPYLYILFGIFFLIAYLYEYSLLFVFTYLIVRGFLVPRIKSNGIFKFNNIKTILLLPLTAIIFDISRIAGYLFSVTSLITMKK